MARVSPTVSQFEFAARVRALREARGLGAKVVSDHLGFSRNFWSAVENSRALLSPDHLEALFEILEVGADDAADLTRLLDEARQPGWWQSFTSTSGEDLVRFFGLESGASTIRSYEGRVFNGLLQSREFARNVISASPHISEVDLNRTLDVRMRRQEGVLRGESPPKMIFLMSEAVLMQQFGGPDVLRAQLLHVLDLAEKLGDKLDLRVQRFDVTPLGLSSASTLVLLDFDSPNLQSVVWREAGTPIGLADQAELVDTLKLLFEKALISSCSRAESISLVAQRVKDIEWQR
ncbi:MAG: helix-turn-helix domain-containing protein [bacterium]|nr:helix-turn-helix domain-containing protein [bacterium]